MSQYRYVRPETFPPVVKNLLIINVLVWIGQLLLDSRYHLSEKLMLWPVMPAQLRQILVQQGVMGPGDGFNPYQILTHMFAHAAIADGQIIFYHILFNMLALWMFGRILEGVWGAKRFLIFYLASGIGAALFHLAIQYFRCEQLLHAIQANDMAAVGKLFGALAPALGASGAIMGVFAGFAYLFPNTELLLFYAIPVKAKWVILGLVAVDLFGGISPMKGDNVAHFAHLGGAITGFIIVFIWNKTNKRTFY